LNDGHQNLNGNTQQNRGASHGTPDTKTQQENGRPFQIVVIDKRRHFKKIGRIYHSNIEMVKASLIDMPGLF